MANRQYTFRTTKSTSWMEPILDDLSIDRDRSTVIREIIAQYFESTGLRQQYEEKYGKVESVQSPIKRLTLSVTGVTNVTQSQTKSQTIEHNVTQNPPQSQTNDRQPLVQEPTPTFEVLESEESSSNLDDKLDSLDFDFDL